jgi:hypothetical protein
VACYVESLLRFLGAPLDKFSTKDSGEWTVISGQWSGDSEEAVGDEAVKTVPPRLKPDSFCDSYGIRSTRTSLGSVLAQDRLWKPCPFKADAGAEAHFYLRALRHPFDSAPSALRSGQAKVVP